MSIFLVENNADVKLREEIAQLMMGQIEAIADENAHSLLTTAIDLTLTENSSAKMFAVREQEQIVGLAFINIGISLEKGGYYIWLNDLYVHKDFRQKGIAKKLLLHLLFWAEQHNLKGIELETGINNAATKRLYNSLGFHDIVSMRYGLDI